MFNLLAISIGSIGAFLLKLLLLVLVLGIIILVHEFGHFIWAKHFGVHIYEFSLGMGPILHNHKGKDNIDYNIRAIPIGGFVSMAGEVYDDADGKVSKDKLLCNKPWYQRLIIMVAGVVNNFILAIVLFMLFGFIWGGGAVSPIIGGVEEGSASQMAGLKDGDKILAINGYNVKSWDKAQIILYYKNNSEFYTFKIKHSDGKIDEYKIIPQKVKDDNTGEERNVFGISIKNENVKLSYKAIGYGFKKFGSVISSMAATIGGLFTGKISLKAMSGPVGIYEVVGESLNYSIGMAISYIMYITAFLSVNVGFINILPFPAFDGGHVLFLVIEKIKRGPVNAKIENTCHLIGFILIFLLMIIVTINDVIKLF